MRSSLLKVIKNEKIILWIFIALCTFSFVYKLDAPYFFTDEILYTDAGNEYIESVFTKNLQHPFVAKYIVGFVSLFGPKDVYLSNAFYLRLPFALMGVLSCYLIYRILRDWKDNFYLSLFGASWYLFLPFTYTSTRMVMMEAPMHLFWLSFHLFFLRALKDDRLKNYLLAGIFIGLGLGTKLPTIILLPFSLIIYFIYSKKKFSDLALMYLSAAAAFGATYVHFLLSERLWGLKQLYLTFRDTILARNQEGKEHVVNGVVYQTSPWWYYLYYIKEKYHFIQILITLFGLVVSFIKRKKFVIYWVLFLTLELVFFQVIPLKAERYISTLEIPLPFLITAGAWWFLSWDFSGSRKMPVYALSAVLLVFYFQIFLLRIYQEPTGYHALRNYIEKETKGFSDFKRVYIYGSVRSVRWYKQNTAEGMFEFSKKYEDICWRLNEFDYVFFDKNDLARGGDGGGVYDLVQSNVGSYERRDFYGFEGYVKKDGSIILPVCL